MWMICLKAIVAGYIKERPQNMTPDERTLIRSKLHQTDLLLRQLDRKIHSLVEQVGVMHGIIQSIEDLKKPIYTLLDREAEKDERST